MCKGARGSCAVCGVRRVRPTLSVPIEWLVATDQPIQALQHPKFREMVDIAARATNGVKIPKRQATRAEIMRTFKNHLTRLRNTLNRFYVSYDFTNSRVGFATTKFTDASTN
ncbi:hypothetical protein BDR07DRAFT_1376667 [Suillus spraguei]|nr:hypothetical protein BDR07DRAFT_1376667 [Suillus spraguei]